MSHNSCDLRRLCKWYDNWNQFLIRTGEGAENPQISHKTFLANQNNLILENRKTFVIALVFCKRARWIFAWNHTNTKQTNQFCKTVNLVKGWILFVNILPSLSLTKVKFMTFEVIKWMNGIVQPMEQINFISLISPSTVNMHHFDEIIDEFAHEAINRFPFGKWFWCQVNYEINSFWTSSEEFYCFVLLSSFDTKRNVKCTLMVHKSDVWLLMFGVYRLIFFCFFFSWYHRWKVS